jgi:hypothetical protein
MPYHRGAGKIDIITKMFRNLPFKTSNQIAPSKVATVYRIERLPYADKFRIVYGVEVPRTIEISGLDLKVDFSKTMHLLSNQINMDAAHITHHPANHSSVQPMEDDIEIEVSL